MNYRTEDIKAVRCDECGAIHAKDENSYVTVAGNILIGQDTQVVGNNLRQNMSLARSSVYCLSCFRAVTSLKEVDSDPEPKSVPQLLLEETK